MMHWEPMMSGWMGGWMLLAPLLFVALAVVVLLELAQQQRATRDERPLAIAARRYARGEITPEQFAQLKAALSDA